MQRGTPQRRREAADGLVMGIILLAKSIEEGPGDDAKGYPRMVLGGRCANTALAEWMAAEGVLLPFVHI